MTTLTQAEAVGHFPLWTEEDRQKVATISNYLTEVYPSPLTWTRIPSESYVRANAQDGTQVLKARAGYIEIQALDAATLGLNHERQEYQQGDRTVVVVPLSRREADRENTHRTVHLTVTICDLCFTQVTPSGSCLCA